MDMLFKLLAEHVYLILFVSLILEFVALPIPGETMMAVAGVMGYSGHANYFLMILSGSLGTIIGMQLSYEVGRRLGRKAIDKYGSYIGLTKPRMNQATKFFNKYGPIVIFIAYYLPGVRHILGYFSGISKVDAKKFHIYSTVGGILWVFTFITMGYILGPSWKYVFHIIHKYGVILFLVALIALIIFLIYKKLGKKDFLIELKIQAKYLTPIVLLIVIVAGFIVNKLGNNMKAIDNVIYTALGLLLAIVLFLYIKLNLKNRTTDNLLVVVDYQVDFVDGSLGFSEAKDIEDNIEDKIKDYLSKEQDIVFTLDTHDEGYLETREGKHIPIEHCLRDSNGHKIYGKIDNYKGSAKRIFEKDTFGSLELARFISRSDYKKVEFVGLVSNICVLSNIILVQNYNKNIDIIVDLNSTLSGDKEINDTLHIYLKSLGVKVK
ncbi:isochorismatase family protein [Gemella sp. GH3]|uniref:isochorismatase family protein n=1 Tax=unclassified Gemella TaxID=2624949 RepID=UPI0015CFD7BA|nr:MULTISPECIES: isochorismatase family protein [unclassified Gemella]MBF0713571.1 isochorismatase family protein [Gemella sp. GH3.1]NYS50523.1 isochorismatase family protein [Gemella sp. GH3]